MVKLAETETSVYPQLTAHFGTSSEKEKNLEDEQKDEEMSSRQANWQIDGENLERCKYFNRKEDL